MPTKRLRVYVTPDIKSLVILGIDPSAGPVTSSALAGALERYADLLPEAAAELGRLVHRSEWGLIADALRVTRFPALASKEMPAVVAVAAAIERAHRDRRLGDLWLLTRHESDTITRRASMDRADARVRDLCDRLRRLPAVHGDAILAGVRWYWAHHAELSTGTREWWIPGVRVKMFESPGPKGPTGAPEMKGTLFDGHDGEG